MDTRYYAKPNRNYSTVRTFINRNAWLYPRKIGVIDGDRALTFKELRDRVNRMSNALLGMGLQKGDRIAYIGLNSLEIFECYLSVPSAGMVLVPMNFRLAPREIAAVLNDSNPSMMIASAEFAGIIDDIRDKIPSVREYVYVGPEEKTAKGWRNYEGLLKKGSPSEPQVFLDQDDLAVLMYTSGTTGAPKGVMMTHLNVFHHGRSVSITVGVDTDDIGIVASPLFHVAGTGCSWSDLYRGCTSVILPRWDAEHFLKLVEKEKITTGMLATPMVQFLLDYPDFKRYDTSSLQRLYCGGAPITPLFYRRFTEMFGNVLVNYYGTTETTGGASALTTRDIENALKIGNEKIFTSIGKGCYEMESYVVNDNDDMVGPGEAGEMKTRGMGVSLGYWNKEEETKEVFKEGWYYTRDICTVDEEGYVYIVDRKKDMVISGGENVYPSEIENVLYENPEIKEAAVIGLPDPKWGEKIAAVVVLKEGKKTTEKEIIDFCRGKIAGYKIPKTIYIDKELPRSPTGKILKFMLRDKYNETT